jgi:glycerate kinase
VVAAPDKFKGSLTAVQAAAAIERGVRDIVPDADVRQCPVADGGEGTLQVLLAAGGRDVAVRVPGPLIEPVEAHFVEFGGVAYIEAARACGIEFVKPSPHSALAAHTWGVGELLRHAVMQGAGEIVLTVGGTASTDGGAGMLQALGCQVVDGWGERVGLGGGALSWVRGIDLSALRGSLGEVRIRVATDVRHPLLGERGAAVVFGPQKGARAREVAMLDAGLETWSDVLVQAGAPAVGGLPGAGAGGGLAFGAMAAFRAPVESGFDLLAELTGIVVALADADLVITGEGSMDEQSLVGKAPAALAGRAAERGVPVLAVAGQVLLTEEELAGAGIVGSRALIDRALSVDDARTRAAELVREQTASLLRSWISASSAAPPGSAEARPG